MIFRQISSLLLKREFSLIFPRYRGKISRGIQLLYQNFCHSSLLVPILLLVFMRKSAKLPCVQTNPDYHQGTPGPPEWAGIIDLTPTNKTDSKNISEKELCLFKNHEKSKKARFYGDFRINVTLFSERFFGI